MANMNFDFNKVKRSFLTVTLKDGRTLPVKMPMKKTFEKMTALKEVDTESMSIDDAMDTLGGLVGEILTNNMKAEKVTTEYITENYDTEEMNAFIDSYMNFVSGVKDNPN
jgi:hypothetical protein